LVVGLLLSLSTFHLNGAQQVISPPSLFLGFLCSFCNDCSWYTISGTFFNAFLALLVISFNSFLVFFFFYLGILLYTLVLLSCIPLHFLKCITLKKKKEKRKKLDRKHNADLIWHCDLSNCSDEHDYQPNNPKEN
jgi:hypothetical protein